MTVGALVAEAGIVLKPSDEVRLEVWRVSPATMLSPQRLLDPGWEPRDWR
jgi:hypothetical protein